jgi:F-box protein 11
MEIIGDGLRAEIIVESSTANTVLAKTDFGRIANLTLRQTGTMHWRCVNITQGRLQLEDCEITSQDLVCIAVEGGADPRIRRCDHSRREAMRAYVSNNARGTFEDNDIFGHSQSGVEIWTGGDPVLRRNRIHDCDLAVVLVHDMGRVRWKTMRYLPIKHQGLRLVKALTRYFAETGFMTTW